MANLPGRPPPNHPSEQQFTIKETGRGAIIRTLSEDRDVKSYPILEAELDRLASIEHERIKYFSFGAGSFTLLLGCLWDILMTENNEKISSYAWAMIIVLSLSAAYFTFSAIGYAKDGRRLVESVTGKQTPTFWEQLWNSIGNRILRIVKYPKD